MESSGPACALLDARHRLTDRGPADAGHARGLRVDGGRHRDAHRGRRTRRPGLVRLAVQRLPRRLGRRHGRRRGHRRPPRRPGRSARGRRHLRRRTAGLPASPPTWRSSWPAGAVQGLGGGHHLGRRSTSSPGRPTTPRCAPGCSAPSPRPGCCPALVGPLVAGIAHHLGGLALGLPRPAAAGRCSGWCSCSPRCAGSPSRRTPRRPGVAPRWWAVLAGLGIGALQYAGQRLDPLGASHRRRRAGRPRRRAAAVCCPPAPSAPDAACPPSSRARGSAGGSPSSAWTRCCRSRSAAAARLQPDGRRASR